MLSRTADHLYWMSRYMERAENTAARWRARLCSGFATRASRVTGPLHVARHPEQVVGSS